MSKRESYLLSFLSEKRKSVFSISDVMAVLGRSYGNAKVTVGCWRRKKCVVGVEVEIPHSAPGGGRQGRIRGARICAGVTPMGALKILRRLEKEGVLASKVSGKAIFYRINFDNDYPRDYVKFILRREAEHNLKLMINLRSGEFSDWCGSAAFYAMYHSLLAILAKFGYESGNQECTFALVSILAEDGAIKFDTDLLESIANVDPKKRAEKETITEIREDYQYGVKLSMGDKTYEEMLVNVRRVLGEVKRIIEE